MLSFRFTLTLTLLAAPCAARAQVDGGVEVQRAGDYVWRGITRSNLATVQPAAWIAVFRGDDELSAGAWGALGNGAGSELDTWAQYTRHLPGIDASLGVIRYTFLGSRASGGPGDDASTAEVYAQLAPTVLPWIEPKASLYQDVDRTRALYLELDGSHSFSIFPLTPVSLVVGATGGFNLREPRLSADPGHPWAAHEGTGATHVDVRGGLTARLNGLSLRWLVHRQRSLDDASRQVRVGVDREVRWWTEAGVSLAFGGEWRPR